MPCRVDPIYVNRTETNEEMLKDIDYLTHQLDIAREEILAHGSADLSFMNRFRDYSEPRENPSLGPFSGVLTDDKSAKHLTSLVEEGQYYENIQRKGRKYTKVQIRVVQGLQEIHRMEDLTRLMHKFSGKKEYADKLDAVRRADITKPLEPQLGFDPDEY